MAKRTYVNGKKIINEIPMKSLPGGGFARNRVAINDIHVDDDYQVLESSADYKELIEFFEELASKIIVYGYPPVITWGYTSSYDEWLMVIPFTYCGYHNEDFADIRDKGFDDVKYEVKLVFGQQNENTPEVLFSQIVIEYHPDNKKWYFKFFEV